MVVQLLFCGMLFPGFVQNSMQHSHVALIKLFLYVVHPYSSSDTSTALEKSCYILSDRSYFHMIDNLLKAVSAFTRHMLTSRVDIKC